MNHISTKQDLITGAKLAAILGVSAPAVSKAVKKGNKCAGIDIRKLAVFNEDGSVKGYRMNDTLPSMSRENPKEQASKKGKPKAKTEIRQKETSSLPQVNIEKGAVRLFDDPKPIAESIVVGTGITKIPEILNTVPNLAEGQQGALLSAVLGLTFGIFGASLSKENKTVNGLIGALFGIGLYWASSYAGSLGNLTKDKQEKLTSSQMKLTNAKNDRAPVIPLVSSTTN